jgi:hypothetical protein
MRPDLKDNFGERMGEKMEEKRRNNKEGIDDYFL